MDKLFLKSFEAYRTLGSFQWNDTPCEWIHSLYRYYFYGITPGGFLTRVLANDMVGAMNSCHPANDLSVIKELCNWLSSTAPRASWGNNYAVEYWTTDLNDRQREEILIRYQLAEPLFDKIKYSSTEQYRGDPA